MNEVFEKWLVSGGLTPCCFREGGVNYAVMRVEKNPDFDYLFSTRLYGNDNIRRGEVFGYAGVYCKKDGQVYDVRRRYIDIGIKPDLIDSHSADALQEQLRNAVRKKVEEIIGNDKGNLQATCLTDEKLWRRMEEFYLPNAANDARRRYLDAESWQPLVFRCAYVPESWGEKSLLAYIADMGGYTEKEAGKYIADNQEKMLYTFLENEAIESEYQKLMEDRKNPVHTIKRIKNAMARTDAKTVNVTIHKDGVDFTFKTDADVLRRDCWNFQYSAGGIVASDRRMFEDLFGRYADYAPDEIVCITYNRKEIYRAEG